MGIEERRPGVWRIRVSAGFDKVTGKRRVINRTIHGDKKDAERVERRLLIEVGSGAVLGTNATVADLIDAWLPAKKLAPSTRDDWERVVRLHIVPLLGDVPLSKLDVFAVDQFYADLERRQVSPTRIRKVHTVLSVALQRAKKWGWIAANPCVDADLPAEPEHEAVAPDPDSVRKLFELADTRGMRLLVQLRLAASLGCRRGELCGLKWADVDLDGLTVHVRRTVGVTKSSGPYVKDYPKNEKRRRPEPIPKAVADLLRRWRIASPPNQDHWVFGAPEVGGFYRPNVLSHEFAELRALAGIPPEVKLHSLRHYVGTHLRDLGVDHDVISRRLGHSRTSTTLDMYGHAVAGRSRDAAELLELLTNDG